LHNMSINLDFLGPLTQKDENPEEGSGEPTWYASIKKNYNVCKWPKIYNLSINATWTQ
jgi:hypothetical protein